MTTNKRTRTGHDETEILGTLRITKIEERKVGGSWVTGTIEGHRFSALVFPEHAECAEYELDDSRISKISVHRMDDGEIVANFDRGWDIRPADATARTIVDLLAAGLAETVFGA